MEGVRTRVGSMPCLCPCPASLSLPQPISLMMFVLRGKYWPNQLKTRMQWSVQIRNMWFMSTWSEFRPKLRPQWGNDSQWSQHLSNASGQFAGNATNASYCPILENKLLRKEDALGILLTQQWHNQNQRALHTSTVAFHHVYNFPLHIQSILIISWGVMQTERVGLGVFLSSTSTMDQDVYLGDMRFLNQR